MGRVASKAIRPVKNFNVENRAHKLLDSEIPRPAPRHPSTAAALDDVKRGSSEFYEEQQKKNEKLDGFLKKVKVDSVGDNPEIRSQARRSLPEDRRKTTPAEYGLPDPEQVTEGRASLRQMLEFISMHHLDPAQSSAEKIAEDYKLDPAQTRNVLRYFQTLELHIPSAMVKKNPKLLSSLANASPAQRQTMQGMGEVAKLGARSDSAQSAAGNDKEATDGLEKTK